MPRQRKPVDSLFDIGFPLHSRVGQERARQQIYDRAARHEAREARVADYFNRELQSVYNTTIARDQRVQERQRDQLATIRGDTDTRDIAVAMRLAGQLQNIELRTRERGGDFHPPHITQLHNGRVHTVPPTGTVRSVPMVGQFGLGAPAGGQGGRGPCQIVPPAVINGDGSITWLGYTVAGGQTPYLWAFTDPDTGLPVGVPGIPWVSGGQGDTVDASGFAAHWHWPTLTWGGQNWVGCGPTPDQATIGAWISGQICCSTGGGGGGAPPPPVIGAPPPGQQQCPRCGCTFEGGPGSECNKPLYVVICIPKPEEQTCPPPMETSSLGVPPPPTAKPRRVR